MSLIVIMNVHNPRQFHTALFCLLSKHNWWVCEICRCNCNGSGEEEVWKIQHFGKVQQSKCDECQDWTHTFLHAEHTFSKYSQLLAHSVPVLLQKHCTCISFRTETWTCKFSLGLNATVLITNCWLHSKYYIFGYYVVFFIMHYFNLVIYCNKHPLGCEAQLAWKCLLTPTFWLAVLTHKVGQTDLVFSMLSGFISRSVQARLQVFVCSSYDLFHSVPPIHIQTHIHTQTAFWPAYTECSASWAKNYNRKDLNLVTPKT